MAWQGRLRGTMALAKPWRSPAGARRGVLLAGAARTPGRLAGSAAYSQAFTAIPKPGLRTPWHPPNAGGLVQAHGAACAAVYELLRGAVALHARLAGFLGQLRAGGFLQCSLASLVAVRGSAAFRV